MLTFLWLLDFSGRKQTKMIYHFQTYLEKNEKENK